MDVEEHFYILAASPDGDYILSFICGWGFAGFYTGAQVRPGPAWRVRSQPKAHWAPGLEAACQQHNCCTLRGETCTTLGTACTEHSATANSLLAWAAQLAEPCRSMLLGMLCALRALCRCSAARCRRSGCQPCPLSTAPPMDAGLLALAAGRSCRAAGGRGCQLPSRAGCGRFGRLYPAPGRVLSAQLCQVPQHRLMRGALQLDPNTSKNVRTALALAVGPDATGGY